jgi:hypothetical protein
LFENAVDKLGVPQNSAAFMRMVKGAQSRNSSTKCKLDPGKINQHAQYFQNTFGGAPAGIYVQQPMLGTPWTAKTTVE